MVSNNLFPKSKVIWFTGLSGAGKSTLAQKLNKYLVSMGKKVKIFDGDEIREKFHTKLKFLTHYPTQKNI